MNAWLITWEWDGEHAKVANPLIAILGSRLSEKHIAEFVEHYYLIENASAGEMAFYANRPNEIPYKARIGVLISQIPHGDRITCGHNPYIYARKVSDLKNDSHLEDGFEIISWKEPGFLEGNPLDTATWTRHEGETRNLKWESDT